MERIVMLLLKKNEIKNNNREKMVMSPEKQKLWRL